jgi:DNA polymerase-3 subunit delta'
MVVVERSGPFITMEQARELRKRAAMSPAEGDRQAFLLLDFHLVREAAGALLKTIEEPEPGTFLVLVAEELPAELATIASRCVRIDFGPIPTTVIAERLVAEGVEGARAEAAAASAGGSMARARTLIRDELLTARRDRWWSAPERLDGTGATAAALAEELADSVEEVVAPLAAAQAEERAVVEQQLEDYEIRGRGQLKVIDERHKREQKRIRTTELLAGMRTITDRYRSALDEGLDPSDYAAAADAVQRLCDSLRFNPNERLAMLALLLRLPQLPRRR